MRTIISMPGGVLAIVLLSGAVAAPGRQGGQHRQADLILVNSHVLTVDARNSVVEAIAVRAGRMLAVGSNRQIRALAKPGAEVIDLQGRTATPGLIDTHAHIAEGGVLKLFAVELSNAPDIAEVRRRIHERAATLKPGEWLLGNGWDEGKLAERRYIVARDLDDVAPENPVWLAHTTGHYGVANSRALKLAGVSKATPDVAGGTIDRDATGQPTGVLKEGAQDAIERVIPAPTVAQESAGILASIDEMHREGMSRIPPSHLSNGKPMSRWTAATGWQHTSAFCGEQSRHSTRRAG